METTLLLIHVLSVQTKIEITIILLFYTLHGNNYYNSSYKLRSNLRIKNIINCNQ